MVCSCSLAKKLSNWDILILPSVEYCSKNFLKIFLSNIVFKISLYSVYSIFSVFVHFKTAISLSFSELILQPIPLSDFESSLKVITPLLSPYSLNFFSIKFIPIKKKKKIGINKKNKKKTKKKEKNWKKKK